MKYINYIILFAVIVTLNVYGREFIDYIKEDENQSLLAQLSDSTFSINEDNPILYALDSLANAPYFALCASCDEEEYKSQADTGFPKFTDDVYIERLRLLNHNTPFKLAFNNEVKFFIELYAYKRRYTTAKVLGLSDMYFPLFEELLDKYNLPLEFKYLAVVESALNPTAKSKAGAVGLWQFMLTTGKIYNLEVSSFEDQRSDPYKATDAACQYFKYLYDIYGDWELVLAAYNCGPGNVNKAIRRSGRKKNYWELWPYLPKETRGYVPAFIAVNYIMNYAKEHEINPAKPITAYFDFDTLHINKRIDLNIVAEHLNISTKLLRAINPSYRWNIVPENGVYNTVYLPVNKIGLFIENEKRLYSLSRELKGKTTPSENAAITHYVGKGETIQKICHLYDCSLENMVSWNNLTDTVLKLDQKLIVGHLSDKKSVPVAEQKSVVSKTKG